jgi:hypothetical protein
MAIEERIVRSLVGDEPKLRSINLLYSCQIPFTLDEQPMQAGFSWTKSSANDRDVRQHKASDPVIRIRASALLGMRYSVHRLQSCQELLVAACIGWT